MVPQSNGDNHVYPLVVTPSEAPKTNRMSTYRDNTENDLFLSRDNLVGFKQIQEGENKTTVVLNLIHAL